MKTGTRSERQLLTCSLSNCSTFPVSKLQVFGAAVAEPKPDETKKHWTYLKAVTECLLQFGPFPSPNVVLLL